MFQVKTESFLFEYFLYHTVLGAYTDRAWMFDCLGELWNVEKDERGELFAIAESESVQEVSTINQYMRYRRIKQYNEMMGGKSIGTEKENAMIAIKGEAIRVISQYAMQSTGETTQAVMYKTLLKNAQGGNIVALRILGIIQCEGLIANKDLETGLENLDKAARWGDITSALAILKYQSQNRKERMEMLKTSVKDTIYEYLLEETERKYAVKAGDFNEEILLLRKAFCAKKIRADIYNATYARLVFSPVISMKDKETMLFSERKDLLSETCDLPLHLMCGTIEMNPSAFEKMKLQRQDEQESIKMSLSNSDKRTENGYRPLCLCTDSDYVLDEYVSLMTNAFQGANVERYDVADLREYDFEPTKSNVFLRSLSESKPNVVLLIFKGEINGRVLDLMKGMILTSMRAKFRLVQPTVTMNLSSVLPICICDKHNAKHLQGVTEILYLSALNTAEREMVIRDMVCEKAKTYHMRVVSMEENAVKKLAGLSMENAEKLLDKAMREQRMHTKEYALTSELFQSYAKTMGYGSNNYGFGGAIHEG